HPPETNQQGAQDTHTHSKILPCGFIRLIPQNELRSLLKIFIIQPAEIVHTEMHQRITCIDDRNIIEANHISCFRSDNLLLEFTERIGDGTYPLPLVYKLATR